MGDTMLSEAWQLKACLNSGSSISATFTLKQRRQPSDIMGVVRLITGVIMYLKPDQLSITECFEQQRSQVRTWRDSGSMLYCAC